MRPLGTGQVRSNTGQGPAYSRGWRHEQTMKACREPPLQSGVLADDGRHRTDDHKPGQIKSRAGTQRAAEFGERSGAVASTRDRAERCPSSADHTVASRCRCRLDDAGSNRSAGDKTLSFVPIGNQIPASRALYYYCPRSSAMMMEPRGRTSTRND